jgi:hypothetical protein
MGTKRDLVSSLILTVDLGMILHCNNFFSHGCTGCSPHSPGKISGLGRVKDMVSTQHGDTFCLPCFGEGDRDHGWISLCRKQWPILVQDVVVVPQNGLVANDIHDLASMFVYFSISHVRRTANRAAHLCARNASASNVTVVWVVHTPSFSQLCLLNDCNGCFLLDANEKAFKNPQNLIIEITIISMYLEKS